MGVFKTRVQQVAERTDPKKSWRFTFGISRDIGKTEDVDLSKFRIVKRVEALRKIEGWYDYTQVNTEDFLYKQLVKRFGEEKTVSITREKLVEGIRLGKFMIEKMSCNPDRTAQFIESIRTSRFKLSCNFNDFLRVTETDHYKTCMSNFRGSQLLRDLADPDMCVIYEPDKAGKMRCRMFARLLVLEDQTLVLGLYKIYGNGFTHLAIKKALESALRCENLLSSYHNDGLLAFSYSRVFNPAVKKPVWSDHGYSYDSLTRKLIFKLERS